MTLFNTVLTLTVLMINLSPPSSSYPMKNLLPVHFIRLHVSKLKK